MGGNRNATTFDNIRVLRVLACLGVFVSHLVPRMGVKGFCASVANFGASGVYLFFLISGFLACRMGGGQADWGRKGVLAYYCRRLFRILPLYYAVIFYYMALHGLLLRDVPDDPAGLYWLRYFFLTNACIPGPDNFWSNIGATWTISLFVFFYLCAPLFVYLIRGSVWRAAVLYLALLLLRHVWVEAGLSAYMMAFYYLHFFALGMLAGELAAAYPPAAAAGRLALFAMALGIAGCASGKGNDYFTVLSWGYAAVVLLTGAFLWGNKEGPAARLTAVLDKYSYAIYLVHAAVVDGIVLLQAHVQLPVAAVLGIGLGVTAMGAYLAHRWIEEPANRLGQKLARQICRLNKNGGFL